MFFFFPFPTPHRRSSPRAILSRLDWLYYDFFNQWLLSVCSLRVQTSKTGWLMLDLCAVSQDVFTRRIPQRLKVPALIFLWGDFAIPFGLIALESSACLRLLRMEAV